MADRTPFVEVHVIPRSTGKPRRYILTRTQRNLLLAGGITVAAIAFIFIVATVLLLFGITLGMDQFKIVELYQLREDNGRLRDELTIVEELEREVSSSEEVITHLRAMLGEELADERRAEAERILAGATPYVPGEEPEAQELAGEPLTEGVSTPAVGRTSELAAYVAAGALAAQTTPHGWPLRGWITRGFTPAGDSRHSGLDIAADIGRQVTATAPGVVVFAGEDQYYGLKVVISHASGYTTIYGHNSQLMVEAGDQVTRGQVIALSGNTGASTSPHLHYELRRDDVPLDPRPFLGE